MMNKIELEIARNRVLMFRKQCELLRDEGYNKEDGLEVMLRFNKLEIEAIEQELNEDKGVVQ